MGGRPSDFLGMLGALVGPLGRGPVSRGIGPFINVLAQGWENSDQRTRIQQLGQDLDTQYGGQDIPELTMARRLINQGDVSGGMQLLTQGISARNRQRRADRLAQQQNTAAIAGVNTLQPITEPGITSLEPLTQAQRLAPPTGSPWRNWQNVDRAPTMSEIMARLEEIGNPSARRFAAKSFEKSWRKHAEETQGRRPTRTSRIRSTTRGAGGKPEHSGASRRTPPPPWAKRSRSAGPPSTPPPW
jgi:hypothetical protein